MLHHGRSEDHLSGTDADTFRLLRATRRPLEVVAATAKHVEVMPVLTVEVVGPNAPRD